MSELGNEQQPSNPVVRFADRYAIQASHYALNVEGGDGNEGIRALTTTKVVKLLRGELPDILLFLEL